MVSQFKSADKVRLLGELDFEWPEGTHAIGRLDNNSEGLLLLTTDKRITKLLFESKVPHKRTYAVMVQHYVTEETLKRLQTGVEIIVQNGEKYITTPCDAHILPGPPVNYPSGYKMQPHIPHTWLSITLTEGKFHQVRKMVGSLRHRCLRLVRTSIEDMHLEDLVPGGVVELPKEEFFRLLKLNTSHDV